MAPTEYYSRLQEKINGLISAGNGRISFDWLLKGTWDQAIGDMMAEAVCAEGVDLQTLHEGLWLLLEHKHPTAPTILAAAMSGSMRRDRQVQVLCTALRHGQGARWSQLWPLFEEDRDLGLSVISAAADNGFLEDMTALTDNQLADLYLFLYDCPELNNGTSDDDADGYRRIAWMRDSIPKALSNRATLPSLEALRKLYQSSDKLKWMSYWMIECRGNMRRMAWRPPTPAEMLKLAESNERRFVRSETELVDVICDSIERFQNRLHASQPAIGDIWNTVPGNYRPKEENEITDAVIRFLRDDLVGRGIVTNREVELRPARGGAAGSRTDIQVDAIERGSSNETIRAVVEVKGCWHPELKTAMRSQLVDGYLGTTGIHAGVYLVAWFLCAVWNKADNRKAATTRLAWTVEDADDYLRTQSRELSRDGLLLRHAIVDARWKSKDSKSRTKKPRTSATPVSKPV